MVVPPGVWQELKIGAGRFVYVAVTVAAVAGIVKKLVVSEALLMPAPIQPAKSIPEGGGFALSETILPAP